MNWLWWAIGGGAVLLAGASAKAALLARYTKSATATAKGIDNSPDDADEEQRLVWLSSMESAMLPIFHANGYAGAKVTSVYRSDALNSAIAAASSTSRHRYGLALDFGGIGAAAACTAAARMLKSHRAELPAMLRTVIAEVDHVHTDYFDPLHKVDSGGGSVKFLQRIGTSDSYESL